MSEQKNQIFLIESFVESGLIDEGYILKIYGEGILRDKIQKKINDNDIGKYVILAGNVDNIFEHILDAACFVLPSLYEGMPNALMEAMSLGLPCISTDCPCGGPRSLIQSGKNGILVKIDDKYQLIESMIQIVKDKELAKKIGMYALRIRQTHSIEKICNNWEKIIMEIVKY